MQTKTSITIDKQRILMGNEALGRGIVEAGCTLAASYPGTPASGIFPPFFKGGIKGGLLRRAALQ